MNPSSLRLTGSHVFSIQYSNERLYGERHEFGLDFRVESLRVRSSFLSTFLMSSPNVFSWLQLFTRYNIIVTHDKLTFYRKFLCRQAQCFFRDFVRNAISFKHNTSWSYDCHPVAWSTFTFTHTYLSRFSCYRFVRENTDPHLTLTFHVTRYRDTRSFDLA